MTLRTAAVLWPLIILTCHPASAQPANAQKTNDYPAAALREGREGTAHFVVDVTEEGRAENCKITQSTGWADLDKATCEVVILRARFKPRTGEDGKPMRGTYANRVVWKMPAP